MRGLGESFYLSLDWGDCFLRHFDGLPHEICVSLHCSFPAHSNFDFGAAIRAGCLGRFLLSSREFCL